MMENEILVSQIKEGDVVEIKHIPYYVMFVNKEDDDRVELVLSIPFVCKATDSVTLIRRKPPKT